MLKISFILIFSAMCFGDEIIKKAQFSDPTPNLLEESILKSKNTNFDYIQFLRQNYPQSFSLGISIMPNSKDDIFTQKSLERFYDPYFLDFDSNYVKNGSRTLKVYQKNFNFSDVYDSLKRVYKRYIK